VDLGGITLAGSWRARESDRDLAKAFPDPAFDDSEWLTVDLPHHWRSVAELAESDGPVLYRRPWSAAPPARGRRTFLVADGIFYYGDLWLDGGYVGATEGYFVPHAFEVTEALAARDDHVVALEVACPPQRDRTAKRTVTGIFGHWDAADVTRNPGGPWRPLRVLETGPVRLGTVRVSCREATEQNSRLACNLILDAIDGPLDARLHATVVDEAGRVLLESTRDVVLAAGENRQEWLLTVEQAPRWWPRTLGEQPMCDVTISVEAAGATSDQRVVRTAFREVHCDGFRFSINGETMFLKGTNLAPTRMHLADTTPGEIRGDLELACDANLDFVRVHAHVAREELYAAADELGLLVWQDLPLQWGYARGVRKQAVRQGRAMVDLLGHHPSVFLWCGHNAPFAMDREPGETMGRGAIAKLAATTVLPTWSKQVLDRSIARGLSRRDNSRPVLKHSGVFPGIADSGTDAHLYFGWYLGDLGGLARALRQWPRTARFVSEFGAQAVPATAAWMQPELWPDLDWERLARDHMMQVEVFERRTPPQESKTFDEWRELTQAYQAALLQLQVEDLRRIKYAPTGGFAQFSFADPHPMVSWSVLDHERVPKRGYAALRDACRPVLPMVEPRQGLVHVVNDTRQEYADAIVEVAVDGRIHRFAGDIPPDAVAYVGRVDLADAVDVEVTLTHHAIDRVVNRYPLLVLRAS
jgi:beta-mannosidase